MALFFFSHAIIRKILPYFETNAMHFISISQSIHIHMAEQELELPFPPDPLLSRSHLAKQHLSVADQNYKKIRNNGT